MKKSTKKFTSTFLAAASVAGIVVPATQAFAAEKMTLEKAKELIAYANQKKNFAAFNIAYAAILELKLDEAKQNELLAQLPAWKDVVTPDVQKALDYINIVAKNLELKDYDEAEAYMRENIKDEENKSYLLGAELTVWGKKGVYTEDVTAAVDAILKVWADKTEAAEKAAQEAIAKVKKANNVAYLNASLAEAGKDIVREVKVESVTALNAKQVQVVFNKEMDKDTANTASYYEIKDKGQTVLAATPALQADKKTVILTLDAETKLTNATSAKVTVKKDLKDISGKTLTADYVNSSVALADNKLPEVVGLKATGLKTIQITFDEPVYNGTSATIMNNQIEVKSGIYNYTVTSIKADYSRRTLTVTVGTNLLEGEISVKLNAKGMTDSEAIRDFSGLVLLSQEQKLVYSKDNSIATAELVSVNKASKKAIVKFSKPVYGSNVVLYHSVSGQSAYGTAAVTKVESAASDTWEFTFTNAIPSGNLNFYLVNDPNSANNQLTDLFGVKVPNATFTYNVVTDVVPPTVSEVKLNTNASIDVIFSEEIDLAEAKKANFEILRADGTVVQYNISNDGAKKVTLTPLSVLEDIATYTINVKAMKDVAGNAMAAAYSTTVKVGDNTNPYVSKAFTVAGEKKIFITFSEAMNESEMGNKANYLVDADGSGAAKNLVALGTDDTVTVIDNKNIVITLANAITTPSVTIAPITDLAGKRIGTNTTLGYSPAILQNISGEKLTVDKAEVIAKNKVKLTFNTSLGAFDNTDFKFVQNLDGLAFATPISIQSVESNAVNSDGKSEVVVVLDRNLNADTTYNDNAANEKVEIVVTAGNTKSANGTVLTARTHVDDALLLTDKLAGAIAVDADSNKLIETHDYDADGKIDTITVKYTEAIKEDTLSRLTFTVEGYTVTGVSVDDDGSVAVGAKGTGAGQFIVINVEEKSTPDGDATPVVRQALDITDMSDNIIVAQTAGTPALDKVTTPSENEELKDGANSITAIGTYGPAAGEKTFTGTVDINTNAVGTITLRNLNITKSQGVTHSITVNAPNATIALENVKVNGVLINDIASSSLHLRGNTIIEGELSIKDKNDNARVVVEGKAEVQGNTLVNSGATLLAQGTSQKPFGNVEADLKDKNKTLSLDGDFKNSNILVKSSATLDLKSDKPAKNIEAKADIEIKAENADILVKAFEDIKKDDAVSVDISEKVKNDVKEEAKAILELNKAHKDLAITFADGDHKDSVTKDLILGSVPAGIAITWESNNSQIITNDGKVTRPLDGKDVEVKLTATITKGNKEMARTFVVTVKAVVAGEIDVVDIKESELEEHIVGTYYVTLRLKTDLDYSKYTAKIKGADIEMVYDSTVKAFFYENSSQGAPEDITIIVTEKATGKTQEVTIVNSKNLPLSVVNETKLALVEPFTSVYYVKVALKDGLNYGDFTATIKDGKALSYDAELGVFFLESSEGEVPTSLVIVVTEKATGKAQEITINK